MNDHSINVITKYFKNLTEQQQKQFAMLYDLYQDWNAKINVISRKDIDSLYERHVLHSLAIAKYANFCKGTTLMDVGTGGGFPGIPLAIMFPDCHFHLIDSIGKKTMVATEVVKAIGLNNVTISHKNVKEEKGKYHYIISRAVMVAPELLKLVGKNIQQQNINALPSGVILLKGGNLSEEISKIHRPTEIVDISNYFEEEFFETKKILYIQS